MLFLYLFICIHAINTQYTEEPFCNINGEECGFIKEKYMFYVVNQPEGFNLRRDVYMRFAIMLSESKNRKNWQLVLPPWYGLHHWKSTTTSTEPVPWSNFFDIHSLKKYAPVVELHEILDKSLKKTIMLDRIYVLQNFDNAFEDGVFTEKWEISPICNYYKQNLGYTVIANETLCIKFQGKISQIWEILSLHPLDANVMFYHAEIPLHDSYGTKSYWDCRKSMAFNVKLVRTAKEYIHKFFNCEEKCHTYLSVHWRRQDFVRARKNDVPSIANTAKQINNAIKKNRLEIQKVFIATDATQTELKNLHQDLKKLGYAPYFYIPTQIELQKFQDGGVAIIEQIICSHAAFFIGTHESTFTFRIQEEREILGLDSYTTFNRFCPDSGKCEKPSQWNIVH